MKKYVEVIKDNLKYLLNLDEKTAGVKTCLSSSEEILIPHSINFESQDYFVTKILKDSFRNNQNISSIQFPSNSKVQTIEEYAFKKSSIKSIVFPPQVTKISKGTFCNCKKLQKIEFTKDSKLQIIERKAFENSSIESISIPSSISKFKDGWCLKTPNLKNIKILANKSL